MKALLQHEGLRRYAGNTSWLLAEKALRMAVGLFVGVWVARYLGPEQFGLLNYAQSYVFLFSAIATLGLDSIVIRELVKEQTTPGELIGTAMVLKTAGTILMFVPLLLGMVFLEAARENALIVLVIAASFLFQIFYTFDFYFQAKVLSRYSVWAQSTGFLLTSLLKVYFIITQAPLLYFAYAITIETALIALGLTIALVSKSHPEARRLRFNLTLAKKILVESWPLMLSGILVILYMKTDQVMLGEMLDHHAVGQYAAALKFSEIWFTVPMIISNSLFPALINAREKLSLETYLRRLQNLYHLLIGSSVAFSLIMTFLSPWLIYTLYGEAYAESARILSIHVWTSVFVSMGILSSKWFVAEGLTTQALWRAGVGSALNITLNFLVIPQYGAIGASLVTLVSYGTADYLFDLFIPRTRLLFKMKTFSVLFPLFFWRQQKK